MLLLCGINIPHYLVFKESVRKGYELLCSDISLYTQATRVISVYRVSNYSVSANDQLLKQVSILMTCSYSCLLVGDLNYTDIT